MKINKVKYWNTCGIVVGVGIIAKATLFLDCCDTCQVFNNECANFRSVLFLLGCMMMLYSGYILKKEYEKELRTGDIQER